MNKQELIEKIKANGEWFETHRYLKITKAIELIKQTDEPQNEKHLHDIKNQIEYLLDHGPGKNKSLRMLENMVDNMLAGYWSLSGEESRDGTWRDAIQVLEKHFECEIPRNIDQVIEGFNSMSGLMNSVEFELDKQGSKLTSKEFVLEALNRYKQKVKVPAFVAEWIIQHCAMGKYVCLERFMCQYNSVELPTELYNYYDNNKDGARDKVISAILDGYEVEEEPKWVVKHNDDFYIEDLVKVQGKKHAKPFGSESEAQKWAELCSGTVEKV